MSSTTIQEGARSDATNGAVEAFYKKLATAIQQGKFNISDLGEAYEGMAVDLPLAGQYVQARRALFDEADKLGIGDAVRVIYHSTETGARTSAALTAGAAALSASNYGAAGAATVGAANLMAATAGPLGLGVAVAVGALTAIFGGKTSAEEAADLVKAIAAGKAAMASMAKWPAPARKVFMDTPFYKTLKTMADMDPGDPLALLADPALRERLRMAIYQKNHVILGDAAMIQAFKDRISMRQKNQLRIAAANMFQAHRDNQVKAAAASKTSALAGRLSVLNKTTKGLQISKALLQAKGTAPAPARTAAAPATKAPTPGGVTGSDVLKVLAVGAGLFALKSAL